MIELLSQMIHPCRVVELLYFLHCLLLLESDVAVHRVISEKVLLPLLWPLLVRIIVSVSLNVGLLNEAHSLCFQCTLILLCLHLLRENVSVYIICRQCLLLVPVIVLSHEVAIVIIHQVST